jgi:hypothetical protein
MLMAWISAIRCLDPVLKRGALNLILDLAITSVPVGEKENSAIA